MDAMENCHGKRALPVLSPPAKSTKSCPALAQDNKKMEALANGNGEDCGTHSYLIEVFMKSKIIQGKKVDQGDEEDGIDTMI